MNLRTRKGTPTLLSEWANNTKEQQLHGANDVSPENNFCFEWVAKQSAIRSPFIQMKCEWDDTKIAAYRNRDIELLLTSIEVLQKNLVTKEISLQILLFKINKIANYVKKDLFLQKKRELNYLCDVRSLLFVMHYWLINV